MKKLYTIVICLIFISNMANSQILEAIHPVYDYSGPADAPLGASVSIKNNGPNNLEVVVAQMRNILPGHSGFFCWYVCYDTSFYDTVSPDSLVILPGTTSNAFYDHLLPNNIPGHDEITYCFYDQLGQSDTLCITFNYDFAPVGIAEMTTSKNAFVISGPNPASAYTSISYMLPPKSNAKLIVSNMLGSKVSEYILSDKQNTLTLQTKDLKSGIYIYSLVIDGKILTSKKLVVTH